EVIFSRCGMNIMKITLIDTFNSWMFFFIHICVVLHWMIAPIDGHGRLIDPPSRVSAWRYGFNTPKDYTDHEYNCGGMSHQYGRNGGKCGICGDAWELNPRPSEAGGKYATG
ncbi:unnamed protein product, partial [Meganyctiphanes norvegica]